MKRFDLGVVLSSGKENEKRLALHPKDLISLNPELRSRICLEQDYGKDYLIDDEVLAGSGFSLLSREDVFKESSAVLIFKPTSADFGLFQDSQALWGAFHCTQNQDIVDIAIKKKLTYLAMESMFIWNNHKKVHWIYSAQSSLAGFSSVMHCLSVLGIKGLFDFQKKVAVLSYGEAGKGAVQACQSLHLNNVTVFTQRHPDMVKSKVPGVSHKRYAIQDDGSVIVPELGGGTITMQEALKEYDIVINCILQDPLKPCMFMSRTDAEQRERNLIIIDVSCDHGMGFEFAEPTTFDSPLRKISRNVLYYGVDHSPSYFYQAATHEMSKATLPYLQNVLDGPEAWNQDKTLKESVEIEKGVIHNQEIIKYQGRDETYPHAIKP